jgi:MFS family permease
MSTAEPAILQRPLLLLLATRLCSNGANQMQSLIIGWHIYDLTNSALAIAFIGLCQFIPPLCLALISGQVADSYDRKNTLRICYAVELSVSLSLVLLTLIDAPAWPVYPLLLVNASARAFEGPSTNSILAVIVPRAQLGRAVPMYSSVGRLSTMLGPVTGGLLFGLGGGVLAFGAVCMMIMIAMTSMSLMPTLPPPPARRQATWETVLAGAMFVWSLKPLMGAMTLDLVATLFGGVTALLPIFARDILHVGPEGMGLLRSAPACGAITVAIWLSRRPIARNAGLIMFAGMTLYGVATIGFALSTSFLLSWTLLYLVGFGDMTSGSVRQTLIHTATPDDRRGRVLALNALSNNTAGQLGQFETGLAAALLGASGAVIFGGIAVFAIVGLWAAYLFPELRKVNRIADVCPPR